MCSNGTNAAQTILMINIVDDYVSLGYRWTHKIAHQAADGGFSEASNKLHEAQRLLADARALLDEACDALEAPNVAPVHDSFTAKLV